jgi:hypothetical protein
MLQTRLHCNFSEPRQLHVSAVVLGSQTDSAASQCPFAREGSIPRPHGYRTFRNTPVLTLSSAYFVKSNTSVNCDVCCFLTVFTKKSQLRLHSVLRKYLIRSSSDDLSETDHVAITSSDSSFWFASLMTEELGSSSFCSFLSLVLSLFPSFYLYVRVCIPKIATYTRVLCFAIVCLSVW